MGDKERSVPCDISAPLYGALARAIEKGIIQAASPEQHIAALLHSDVARLSRRHPDQRVLAVAMKKGGR